MHKFLYFLVYIFPIFLFSQPVKISTDPSLIKEMPLDTSKWMSKDDIASLNKIRVTFRKPNSLNEVSQLECFKENAKLELMLSCIGNQLHSKKSEFITFLPLTHFLTMEDSIRLQRTFPDMIISNLNNQHCYQIRAQILYSLGKDANLRGENANFDWKPYVHYYSRPDAVRKFNADTAISYGIKLSDNELYKGKYKYLKALFLQKRGRGFIAIYIFCTETGLKQLVKNWQTIENIYKYEE